MKLNLKWIFPMMGWALLILSVARWTACWYAQWIFGVQNMPVSMLALDTWDFPKGSAADAVAKGLILFGTEEEVYLFLAAILGCALACALHEGWSLRLATIRHEESKLRREFGMPPEDA